jgi:hypothetical protein
VDDVDTANTQTRARKTDRPDDEQDEAGESAELAHDRRLTPLETGGITRRVEPPFAPDAHDLCAFERRSRLAGYSTTDADDLESESASGNDLTTCARIPRQLCRREHEQALHQCAGLRAVIAS